MEMWENEVMNNERFLEVFKQRIETIARETFPQPLPTEVYPYTEWLEGMCAQLFAEVNMDMERVQHPDPPAVTSKTADAIIKHLEEIYKK